MAESDQCRLCLESGGATLPIFQKKHGVALAKLTDILQVELRVGNGLPGRICSVCASQLDAAYSFKQRCLASQKELKGQTMRAVQKASAGTRARRQAKKYSDTDSDCDGETNSEDDENRPTKKLLSITLRPEGANEERSARARQGGERKKVKTTLSKENNEGGKYECRFCDVKFVTAEEMDVHLESHEEKTKTLNKCLVCGIRFQSQSVLRAHLQLHVGESPVQCSLCEKVFLNETYLGNHLKSHTRPPSEPTSPKPFKCDTCDKSFLKQAHLVEHMRSHTGDRPFRCDACDKSFTTKCNLTRHSRMHSLGV